MNKATKIKIALEDGTVFKGFSFGLSKEGSKKEELTPIYFFKKLLTFFKKLIFFTEINSRDDKGVLSIYKEVEGAPFPIFRIGAG